MPIITTKIKTPLKRQNRQLTELPIDDFVMLRSGKKLAVQINPMVGDSLQIVMAGNDSEYSLSVGDVFYIYAPDWETGTFIKKSAVGADKVMIDNIPYYAQNDTSEDGFRLCNAHSCAMLCAYLLGDEYDRLLTEFRYDDQPELLYIERMRKYGDSTDHNVQTRTLETFGIESYWSDRISPVVLHNSLNQSFGMDDRMIRGIPLVAGLAYKQDGHILLIKGYKNGSYIVNDPNGKRSGILNGYYQKSTNVNKAGENDIYSKTAMDLIFWDLGKNNGYGRIVTKVKGCRTGLK